VKTDKYIEIRRLLSDPKKYALTIQKINGYTTMIYITENDLIKLVDCGTKLIGKSKKELKLVSPLEKNNKLTLIKGEDNE
jgi:hypothetical protein